MSTYKIGQKVYIKEIDKIGTITKLTQNNEPEEVLIGNKVINVINMLVSAVTLLKPLWLLLKSIFKRKK